ncbi:MAG TPA: PEP-utilizing enzyme [Rhodocyclaceae bacterium]
MESTSGFSFGTKAATLGALKGMLKQSLICDCCVFTVKEWGENKQDVLSRVRAQFSPNAVIVRSSALNEDDDACTMAGAYLSVKDVATDDLKSLGDAIEQVIASYGDGAGDHEWHEILVQPMISNVSMSGVVFSHDLASGAPYYVINYDDVSGKTDTVTSGSTDTSRTLLVHRAHAGRIQSPRFRALLKSVQEIEQIVNSPGVDLEFAVTNAGEIYIFQVRRLSLRQNWNRDISYNIDAALGSIQRFLQQEFRPKNGVFGENTIYGEMPDWNPAEMIGTVPRPLARSLYQNLITDSVWAEARAEMGYRDLSGRPLMVGLCGRVFIDVRESLNSFLPADLPAPIGEKLANAWLDRLRSHPELHDKVEFEVMVTAFSLDFEQRLDLSTHGLDAAERACFRDAVRRLTVSVITGKSGDHALQQQRLQELERRRKALLQAQPGADLLMQVNLLLRDCRALGTLPFAILARHGFIAEIMLRSLVRTGVLDEERARAFRASVPTVLTEFLHAIQASSRGERERAEFMAKYGHLRPGTYDILANRYDQHGQLLQDAGCDTSAGHTDAFGFELTTAEDRALADALTKAGLAFDNQTLLGFMRRAIAGREQAKLIFTRNVSAALELIAQWGGHNGLSRDELSFLSVDQILDALSNAHRLPDEDRLREIAKSARADYEISQAIRLPYLISSEADVFVIPLLKSRANFVTAKRIQAQLQYVSDHAVQASRSARKVVLIERADPGYDWIFLSPIAGLVTKYGGANSHMAIRCAELNIPAAIGCGEQMFEQLRRSSAVLLDCAAAVLVPVR